MHFKVNKSFQFKLLLTVIPLFSVCILLAQPKYYTETFDKDAGWKLSSATPADSAQFEIKDGSLILHNRQRNAGMVEMNIPFFGDLSHDGEWELRLKVRHLDGINNFQFGICQGAKPGTFFTDGLSFGLAANGYYRMDSFFGKTKNEIKGWTKYGPVNTADGTVNEIRIIYRSPWGFFVLINDQWAFMGRGSGREGKTLTLFAEGHQSVAFDQIDIVSYRGQFTKLADVKAKELREICRVAVDSFANAKGFASGDQYKTWLPEIFICNKDYKIFKKTTGVFPKKISGDRPFYVYSITTDFQKQEDRDKQKADLEALIETVFVKHKRTEKKLDDKAATYFFPLHPDMPKGTIAILQEYTFRRSYETEDHYYIDLMILNAPDIKPF